MGTFEERCNGEFLSPARLELSKTALVDP